MRALLMVSASSGIAMAQGEAFTQVGSFDCGPGYPGIPPCSVTFPKPFGGIPTVVTMVCITKSATTSYGQGLFSRCAAVPAQSNTPLGFSVPRLPLDTGATHFDGNGMWVAVGPSVFSGTASAKYIVLTVLSATKAVTSRADVLPVAAEPATTQRGPSRISRTPFSATSGERLMKAASQTCSMMPDLAEL